MVKALINSLNNREEVRTLFGYYLECLGRHSRVRNYIDEPTNGYEELRKFMAATK